MAIQSLCCGDVTKLAVAYGLIHHAQNCPYHAVPAGRRTRFLRLALHESRFRSMFQKTAV